MCGIAGFWNLDGAEADETVAKIMRDRLRSRGPDDAGTWVQGDVAFAHRRLSILDLSSAGHQPMSDGRGRVITYNGEVFNFVELRAELNRFGHVFKTGTDTEVLLAAYHQWGERCVDRFLGMFAFAIWDQQRGGIFLARDRLGKKPLYYHHSSHHCFAFASRLGSLVLHPGCPRELDPEALALYLEAGYVPAPLAMLRGVRKLRAGHTMWVDRTRVVESCYWSVDGVEVDDDLTRRPHEVVERLASLIDNSVKDRLVSDVPLGALLSGGTDSAAVVAAMRRVSDAPPLTFTIGFEEGAYDESGAAAEVAALLGTRHHSKIMRSADLLALLDEHAVHYDEPFADWSSLPTMLVSRFAREHVTVCLSGDGGDELFSGYPYYNYLRRLGQVFDAPPFMRRVAGYALRRAGRHRLSLLGSALLQPDLLAAFAFMRSFRKDLGVGVLAGPYQQGMAALYAKRAARFPAMDLVSTASRLDIVYYLADDILQKVDVASMSVGLETRTPLLDHRIVEFALSIPQAVKVRGGQTKWPLKQVVSRSLPDRLVLRPKSGFGAPIREWFRADLRAELRESLSAERLSVIPEIDAKVIQSLLDLHLSGKRDTHPLLWSVLTLVRWYEGVIGASAARAAGQPWAVAGGTAVGA